MRRDVTRQASSPTPCSTSPGGRVWVASPLMPTTPGTSAREGSERRSLRGCGQDVQSCGRTRRMARTEREQWKCSRFLLRPRVLNSWVTAKRARSERCTTSCAIRDRSAVHYQPSVAGSSTKPTSPATVCCHVDCSKIWTAVWHGALQIPIGPLMTWSRSRCTRHGQVRLRFSLQEPDEPDFCVRHQRRASDGDLEMNVVRLRVGEMELDLDDAWAKPPIVAARRGCAIVRAT